MSVHLIKLAVGVENMAHLSDLQKRRMKQNGRKGLFHFTRSTPRRRDEILDGGSIYWVIGGLIRVRQRLLEIEQATDSKGRSRCAFRLDPELIRVEPRARGAFQGWRYLEVCDAPPDLPERAGANDHLPDDMARELRDLGLL